MTALGLFNQNQHNLTKIGGAYMPIFSIATTVGAYLLRSHKLSNANIRIGDKLIFHTMLFIAHGAMVGILVACQHIFDNSLVTLKISSGLYWALMLYNVIWLVYASTNEYENEDALARFAIKGQNVAFAICRIFLLIVLKWCLGDDFQVFSPWLK